MVSATRAAPVLPVIGHRCGSRVSVPSGKIGTHLPSCTASTAERKASVAWLVRR